MHEQEVRPSSLVVMTFFRAEDMWDFWLNLGRQCGDRKKNMNYAYPRLIWLSSGGFEFLTGKRLNFNQHIKWLFFNVYF